MSTDHAYQRLQYLLLQELDQQRWKPGQRLPSIRQLCQQHGLSKATVLHALQRLEASGRIEARSRSGYFVRQNTPAELTPLPLRQAQPPTPAPVNVSELLADIMQRGAAFDLLPRELQQQQSIPGIQILNRSIGRALRQQQGVTHLHYDEPAGYWPLRQQLALRYQNDGCALTAEDLCITSGCQHALFLALKACCNKGDLVAVESPGFYGVLQLLEQLELRVLEIPASPVTGMDLEWLEKAARQWPIRACVVTPAFATPTGSLMPVEQQKKLLQLAEQMDFTLIEDDIYRELGFYSRPSPLKALDQQGRVILCGSFSKTLSRDLRLGWIHAGRWQSQVVRLKLVTQLASSRFVQQGLAAYLEDGHYDRHLRQRCITLQQQSEQLMQELETLWPQGLHFSRPQGGLCLWAEWQQPLDSLQLYHQALQASLVITPGPLFSASGQFGQALRLSFTQPCTGKRYQALQDLRKLINELSGTPASGRFASTTTARQSVRGFCEGSAERRLSGGAGSSHPTAPQD
ncbi:PLP-dependent aminotransferase family protein [Marinospirillum alkaliphilum]|uniref:DNA-binding transcriptional regulator, MocR family, contains an aminotransferase domain n=1 Tax=Marinospirillum alkaliphilum DSM 21637 TaxID=1122209 RepID=A0A1K1X6F4_9GAMM|nr:PLP-dependent aminotransferase family protein [Marinospirillum alkaliphilum]SFX45200.1 DNA-binding transcriptional regulator, MocR family, contains an aminotransferase domain [Marinospirillum alkaliphilum DSM 21637]